MKHKVMFTMLVVVALLLGSTPAIAQEEGPTRSGLRLDAPTFGVRGPYPVGTMDMVLENEDRPLPVSIWYPALNPDGLAEERIYPLIYPPVFPPLEAYGKALFEAVPDTENGSYPLVVWSHGFTSFRNANLFFVEHLASWGFVVIAPDHLGMTAAEVANDPDSFWPMYYLAPKDVSLVIDFAEQINSEGVMSGMIDLEHIAASGHSAGGFTALQASGGQLDIPGLAERCAVAMETNDGALLVTHFAAIAEWVGRDSVPEGLLPSLPDARIDVVVPMAPDQLLFGETGLNAVTVPALYMVGNADVFVPFSHFEAGFPSLGSENAYMVVFDHANHGVFQDTCETFPAMVEIGLYDLCAEKVWDKLRAHDLINHYGTAFMLWQLKSDEAAAAVFGQEAEDFPGVELIEK